jgi:hypothetical protein
MAATKRQRIGGATAVRASDYNALVMANGGPHRGLSVL